MTIKDSEATGAKCLKPLLPVAGLPSSSLPILGSAVVEMSGGRTFGRRNHLEHFGMAVFSLSFPMKNIKRILPVIVLDAILVATLLGLTSCSSTQLESAWHAPEVGSIKFTKVLVVAAVPTESLRRQAEAAMKLQVTGIPVVTSSELIPVFDDLKDRAKMAKAIEASGVDGIVVLRAISNETEVIYIPGRPMPMPYRSLYGYFTRPYGMSAMYWDAGRVTTDRVIGVETNIYQTKNESLLWSGFTKTTNPGNMEKLVGEVAGVVRSKLRAQKLIP